MSSLTVKAICKRFTSLSESDLKQLTNSSEIKPDSQVSLSRIANYSGKYDNELCIWAAKKEGAPLVNILSQKKQKLVQEANVVSDSLFAKQNESSKSQNPMSPSIFNMKRPDVA